MSSRPTSSRAPLPYRSTSHHTISTSAIQTPVVWSTDLQEATEAAEAALNDPKTSGSLYIRLLVKAVGGLNCEEDAERMIFEVNFHYSNQILLFSFILSLFYF